MLLNELELSNVPKELILSNLKSKWDTLTSDNDPVFMGRMNNYDVFSVSGIYWPHGPAFIICLYDRVNGTEAGFLELEKKGKAYNVINTGVEPKYMGFGLMTKLYAFLIIKHNYILWTISNQTKGGRAIWEKLAGVKGIQVFAWDAVKKQAHSLDPQDPFNGEVEVYSSDIENEERDVMRQDIRDKEMQLFDLLKVMGGNPTITQKKLMHKYNTEWKAAKDKLEKFLNSNEDINTATRMTLVAQRA